MKKGVLTIEGRANLLKKLVLFFAKKTIQMHNSMA